MIFLMLKLNQKKFFQIMGNIQSNPDRNPLDCAIWSVLENKTNATSHPNSGLLNITIEKE